MNRADKGERPFLLRDREIHVWNANLEAAPSRGQWKVLSEEERHRAARFLFDRDRNRYVLAHSTLRVLLGHYLGAPPGKLMFAYGPNSKPELATPFDHQMLRFNISHSHGQLLIAFARRFAVGVDIEKIRPDIGIEAIAMRFFSSAEVKQLNALDNSTRCRGFFDAWTRKEAYLKARSEGVGYGLERFTVSLDPGKPARLVADDRDPGAVHRWEIRELRAATGYRAAVSTAALRCRVRQFTWRDLSPLRRSGTNEAWNLPAFSA